MENPKNPENNNAKGRGDKGLDNNRNTFDNSLNIAANGNTNRDEQQTAAMDRNAARNDGITDISQVISDKVAKKIESKNYLYDNLLRKNKENVSYETIQTQENENVKSVFDNKLFVFGLFIAVAYAIYKFLKPKNAVKKAEKPLSEYTEGETSGESFSSLANEILLKATPSGE